MRSVALLIVFIGVCHDPLHAQQWQLETPMPTSDRIRPAALQIPWTRPSPVASGVIGGAIGIVAGSVTIGLPLAYALEPTDDGLSTPGIIIGYQLGQALGIATGVHLGTGRQGDFQKAVLLSTAAAALGTALLWTDDFDAVFESRRSQVVLVAVPVTQLVASIYSARNRGSRIR